MASQDLPCFSLDALAFPGSGQNLPELKGGIVYVG